MAGIAHIFRALGALCILPCPPVLWAFNKLWCQKVYVNCLMKYATCAFLLFCLFVDNKGVKTFFISSPTWRPNSTIPQCSGNMSLLFKEVEFTCSAGGRKWPIKQKLEKFRFTRPRQNTRTMSLSCLIYMMGRLFKQVVLVGSLPRMSLVIVN